MEITVFSVFYFLWVFPISGWFAWLKFDFLLRFTNRRERQLAPLFIGVSCLLAGLSIQYHFSVLHGLLAEILLWAAFAELLLKTRWREAIGPAVLLFTLSTFMEGSTAVLMRQLVTLPIGRPLGLCLQLMSSVLSGAFFLLYIPRRILQKSSFAACPAFFSYLYILLLPCAFLVLSVRNGLGLDERIPEKSLSSMGGQPVFFSLAILIGAIATFFILLKVFCRVMELSEQEAEKALLLDRLSKQRLYIDEAGKRNEQYRSFQHDIDNHLLVLSGLLRDGEYDRALHYSDQIHLTASELFCGVSTGNAVLDVLLREKTAYARQCGNEVSLDIHLLEKLSVDDMDLCIIFSNALDNAIAACRVCGQIKPEISVSAKIRHRFLFIEIINPTGPPYDFHYGTGLNNIRRTALKYRGSLEVQNTDEKFRLSILLCLTDSSSSRSSVPPAC